MMLTYITTDFSSIANDIEIKTYWPKVKKSDEIIIYHILMPKKMEL